jgi:hypothetical protein
MIRRAAAIVLIVGTGLLHGDWTNRWGESAVLQALDARFESVPMAIGDWNATVVNVSDRERSATGAVAWLSREYKNPKRSVSVSVVLLAGLPGDVSKHTPDVCSGANGYVVDTPRRTQLSVGTESRPVEFHTALATKQGTTPTELRIFWSWKASHEWSAPDDPRWAFSHAPVLFKLYAIRETAGVNADPDDDPCQDFLRAFLPELDRVVFSASEQVPPKQSEGPAER